MTEVMRRTGFLFERKTSSFYGTEILDASPVFTTLLEGAERCCRTLSPNLGRVAPTLQDG